LELFGLSLHTLGSRHPNDGDVDDGGARFDSIVIDLDFLVRLATVRRRA
jgi:hypothetical protein